MDKTNWNEILGHMQTYDPNKFPETPIDLTALPWMQEHKETDQWRKRPEPESGIVKNKVSGEFGLFLLFILGLFLGGRPMAGIIRSSRSNRPYWWAGLRF